MVAPLFIALAIVFILAFISILVMCLGALLSRHRGEGLLDGAIEGFLAFMVSLAVALLPFIGMVFVALYVVGESL